MNSQFATFGRSGMFACTDDGFRRALDAGHRVLIWQEADMVWRRPICLDEYDSRTLWLIGAGQLGTNIQRDFEGAPCLYAHKYEWRIHNHGVNWLGQVDLRTGYPVMGDDSPLLSFAYLDRSSFKDCGFYGAPVGLAAGRYADGDGPGRVSLTVFDSVECHRSKYHGIDLLNPRNISFDGRCSIERNGQANPSLYNGIRMESSGEKAGLGSIIKGVAFEHDVDTHLGIFARGMRGMHVGESRHMLAGMDVECDDANWYPCTVYGDNTKMIRRGGGTSRWHGRKQTASKSIFGYKLTDEPESLFDLRLTGDAARI